MTFSRLQEWYVAHLLPLLAEGRSVPTVQVSRRLPPVPGPVGVWEPLEHRCPRLGLDCGGS